MSRSTGDSGPHFDCEQTKINPESELIRNQDCSGPEASYPTSKKGREDLDHTWAHPHQMLPYHRMPPNACIQPLFVQEKLTEYRML